jgi:hypothetical protein
MVKQWLENSFLARGYRAMKSVFLFIRHRQNPELYESLPPIPCQFCGQTDHTERDCPNLKEMGFLKE